MPLREGQNDGPGLELNAALNGRVVLLALIGGLLCSAAFAPVSFVPAIVLGPALLLYALDGRSPRAALTLGGLFGFAHFLSGVWWVLISTWGFGGAPLPLAVLLLLMLAAYLALFPALSAWLAVTLSAGRRGRVWLLWPAAWLAGEFARDAVFDGFPWFSLGYLATDWPRGLHLAAQLGVHGVSAIFAALSAISVALLCGCLPARGLALLCAVGLLLWHALAPAPSQWTRRAGEPLQAVLVQGNIPQDQKWRPENRMPTIELYERLTEQAWPADLVIWPEVAIPLPYDYVEWLFQHLDQQAAAQGGTLYAGILTRQDGRNFNTVYALGEDSGRYVKRHLVPFGEYIPVPDWMKPMFDVLGLPFPAIASEGMSGQRTLSVNGQQVSMSICFEDVFPLEVRETATRSGFLVNVTNDAWFEGSAAPEQHLQIARLRAAESGRMLLRVANTGISAVIDADGQLQQTLAWGRRGLLRSEVLPREGLTPYQRHGRTPLWCFLLLSLFAALWGARQRFRRSD